MGLKPSKAKTVAQSESRALRVQGALIILLGIFAVVWPGRTVEVLTFLFAVFLILDGLVLFGWGLMKKKMRADRAHLMVGFGLLQLALGIFLVPRPDIGFETLILILGLALIGRGLFSFVQIFSGKVAEPARFKHAALGFLGVAMGVIILMQPAASGQALVWLLGLYALVAGPVMLAIAADISKAR